MPSDAGLLLDALQSELVDVAGVLRRPGVAGPLPPLFLEPRNGAPAPGELKGAEANANAAVSAFVSGGVPPAPHEAFFRRTTVDVWLRTVSAKLAFQLEDQVRAKIVDRRGFTLGSGGDALPVIECLLWRDIQRLGSDAQGFVFVVAYLFQTKQSTPEQQF